VNAEGFQRYAYSYHGRIYDMPSRKHSAPAHFQELAREVRRYTEVAGRSHPFVTAIEGFVILRSDHAKPPTHRIFKPALCISIQGGKWATFGEKRYDYWAGQALVVTIATPSRGSVAAASPREPYLGIVIELDSGIMQAVMEDLGLPPRRASNDKVRGAYVLDMGPQLADCALRSVRLLETPEAIPLLYPGIMREICYWLLVGPGGDYIGQTVMASAHNRQILQTIHHLRERFQEAVSVQDLASAAGMSSATFHRQFKSATSMTPLQYQKQLRLLEGRRLMLTSDTSVESAALQAGYESASQFSREYSRMFGRPPRRDVSVWSMSQPPARSSAEY